MGAHYTSTYCVSRRTSAEHGTVRSCSHCFQDFTFSLVVVPLLLQHSNNRLVMSSCLKMNAQKKPDVNSQECRRLSEHSEQKLGQQNLFVGIHTYLPYTGTGKSILRFWTFVHLELFSLAVRSWAGGAWAGSGWGHWAGSGSGRARRSRSISCWTWRPRRHTSWTGWTSSQQFL